MKKVAFDLCYLADSLPALWACLNFYNSLITCTSLLCFPVRLLSSQLLVVRMMAVMIVRGKQCWGCGGFTEWKHRGLNAKLAILRIVLLHMACSCHMTSWLAQRQLISDPLLQTNGWMLKTNGPKQKCVRLSPFGQQILSVRFVQKQHMLFTLSSKHILLQHRWRFMSPGLVAGSFTSVPQCSFWEQSALVWP